MRRRGFALVYAMAALALLAGLIALATVGMRQRVDSVAREGEAAQLRQLALAGVQLASHGAEGPVSLPAGLPEGTSVTILAAPRGKVVEAKLGKTTLSVQITQPGIQSSDNH